MSIYMKKCVVMPLASTLSKKILTCIWIFATHIYEIKNKREIIGYNNILDKGILKYKISKQSWVKMSCFKCGD